MLVVSIFLVILSGCGGGGGNSSSSSGVAVPQNDVRNVRVTASHVYRLVAGAATTAVAKASDGGLWVAGVENGLFGRSFLFKQGGAGKNPCGEGGIRLLNEMSQYYDRHPVIQSITPPRDGKFYLAGKGPGGVFVSRYVEGTCQPDITFGDGGHMPIRVEGLAVPYGVVAVQDNQGSVVFALAKSGLTLFKRLTPEGVWDRTFGTDGIASSEPRATFWLGSIALSDSGEIYVAGSVSKAFGFVPAMLKLDRDGHAVGEFGENGIRKYPELSIGTGGLVDLLVESDRVVAIGTTASSAVIDDITTNDSILASVDLRTGVLLPGFAKGGYLRWDWGFDNSNIIGRVIRNKRGGYTACGHTIISFLAGQPIALADFTSNGNFDDSVGYQGRRMVEGPTTGECAAMVYDGDGSFYLAGSDSDALLFRFD